MSLFGSLMRDLERDPIFGAHTRAMNQMNQMMNSMMGGMGGGFGMGMGMLDSPFGAYGRSQGHPRGQEMMPFGGHSMMSPFGGFGMGMGGFPEFDQLAQQHGGNGHSFSSMSVTSITSGPDGRPQVYQASKQTAAGPGGVRETRKALSDSRSGIKKLSVGRHMGEKGHVKEREENLFTGQREENEEFVNMDEEEAPHFDREWKQRAYGGKYTHSPSMPAITGRDYDSRHGRRAQVGYPTRTSESTPSVTIEELPVSDDEEIGRHTETPQSTASMPAASASSSRRSPYTREKKQKSKRMKKYL